MGKECCRYGWNRFINCPSKRGFRSKIFVKSIHRVTPANHALEPHRFLTEADNFADFVAMNIERCHAEASLYTFLRQAWFWIEGGTPFVESWHIEAIAEHLEACYRRDIRNLLIHVPPRSSKTSLISIAFPAWVWTRNPSEKFMYASYASVLALEHSLKCRRLIEAPWYQQRWGNKVRLATDQNAKGFFENTAGGYRISTSVGAAATGRGGSILICDDPNNAKDGESEAKREGANMWWDQVWSTRLNDPKRDVKIVVQQRLHERDISGHILANDATQEWVRLVLPMEFETARRSKTIILPSSNGVPWQDPRTTEGELLCSLRFGVKEISIFKRDLGTYGYAGQYQQRPAPPEGGIIKKAWFPWWKFASPPSLKHVIQSWDTAFETKDTSSYSACTTWGVFERDSAHNVVLLSLWRGKVEYPELRAMAQRLARDYRDSGTADIKPSGHHKPDIVLVESKASGIYLIKDLQRAGVPAFRFDPTKYGDKLQRVRLVTHLIEGGRVWLPAKPPDYSRLRPFADLFLEEAASFGPSRDSRDLVDTMTQVLLRLSQSGWVLHPSDEIPEPSLPSDNPFY